MSFLAPIAGAVVGGLMSDGGGSQQTASKEPWSPAIKPLTNTLTTGQDLERYYQQNPFNRIQQQGYQNLFSDLDQYRNQISPQLMQFANNMMTSNYQRGPRNSQVEAMQGQMPMQRPQMMSQGSDGVYQTKPMQVQGGGLMSAMGQSGMSPVNSNMSMLDALQGGDMSYQGQITPGLLANAQRGAFSAPAQGNYGLLDWTQLNPFTAANGIPQTPIAEKPAEKTPEDLAREEWERLQRSGMGFQGAGA